MLRQTSDDVTFRKDAVGLHTIPANDHGTDTLKIHASDDDPHRCLGRHRDHPIAFLLQNELDFHRRSPGKFSWRSLFLLGSLQTVRVA